MSRDRPKKPTEAELEILRVLWAEGPSTVRRVHELLSASKPLAYTSVLKTLQIMTDKDLVERDESQRAHVYQARQPAEHTKRQLAGDVLQRVFEGSASDLMMHALAGREVSAGEIAELKRLIDDYQESEE
ncbi:MAG: BlaI/MecI/CopY family transcriptional regulator [Acidobacteriota bacterium]